MKKTYTCEILDSDCQVIGSRIVVIPFYLSAMRAYSEMKRDITKHVGSNCVIINFRRVK